MKKIESIEVGLEVLSLGCKVEYTNPLKASFFEFLILEVANSFKGIKSISNLLVNEFEIPKSMLYMFESTIKEFSEKDIVKGYTPGLSLEEISPKDITLTTFGKTIYANKKIPQDWKKQTFEIVVNNFDNTLSLNKMKQSKSKYKIKTNKSNDIEEDVKNIFEYINEDKSKLNRQFNIETQFNNEFLNSKPDVEKKYLMSSIDIMFDEHTHEFTATSKFDQSVEYFKDNYEYEYDIKEVIKDNFSKVDLRKDFKLYTKSNKFPTVFTNYNDFTNSEEVYTIKTKKDYMYGLNKSGYGFVYNIEIINCNGINLPLEQIEYNDQLYIEGISEILEAIEKEPNNEFDIIDLEEYINCIPSNLKSEYFEKQITRIKEKLTLENLSEIYEFIKGKSIKGGSEFTKKTALEILSKTISDESLVIREIEDYRNKFGIKKDIIYKEYINSNINRKPKADLINDIMDYVSEGFVVSNLNVKNDINNALEEYFTNNKFGIEYNLEIISRIKTILNAIEEAYSEYLYNDETNSLTRTKGLSKDDVKDVSLKLGFIAKKVKDIKNDLSNDNEQRLNRKIGVIEVYLESIYEAVDPQLTYDGSITIKEATKKLDAKKPSKDDLEISAFIMRRIMEKNTNVNLEGKEKFIKLFEKNSKAIDEVYDAWRMSNKTLHGEVNKNTHKKLKKSLKTIKKYFDKEGVNDEHAN